MSDEEEETIEEMEEPDDPDELNFPIIDADGELTYNLSQSDDPREWAEALADRIKTRLALNKGVEAGWLVGWIARAMLTGVEIVRDADSRPRGGDRDDLTWRQRVGRRAGEDDSLGG